MIILGIHSGHDSSAAIIKDGIILADVQEERFNRIKHSSNVPLRSIDYCLSAIGLKSINEVDFISFSWKTNPKTINSIFGLKEKDSSKKAIAIDIAKNFFGVSLGMSNIKLPIYYPDYTLIKKEKYINNDHHLVHAASAYYTRKSNDKCLVFTIDGAGDNTSTAVWLAEGNDIKLLQKYFKDASIGWAYSIVTEGLHWIHGDGEGKTMGLAPYGDYNICKGVLDCLFPMFNGTNLIRKSQLKHSYFWTESGSTQFHFEEAIFVEELIKKYGKENIEAEAQ